MICVFLSPSDRSPDVDVTDEDEGGDDPEYSSNEEMSDSEPIPGDDDRPTRPRKFLRGPPRPTFTRVCICICICIAEDSRVQTSHPLYM